MYKMQFERSELDVRKTRLYSSRVESLKMEDLMGKIGRVIGANQTC